MSESVRIAPLHRPLRNLRQRLAFVTRVRYQLVVGLVLAVLVPQAIWFQFDLSWLRPGSSQNTLIGAAVALAVGTFLLQRVSDFPGVGATSSVVPVFAAAYSGLIAAFFFLRLDYSRFEVLASFTVAVIWFSFAIIFARRTFRPLLMLLPFGNSARLFDQGYPHWRMAISPDELPRDCSGVVADLRADLPPEWEKFLATCALHGVPVYHWKQVAESLTGRVEIEHLSENNLGSLLPSPVYLHLKRVADILFLIATLPFTVPLALIIAAAIKLDDGGPVLFRQCRMGFRAGVFTMLKFRTMKVLSGNGPHFTTENDSRVTRVGRFLRRYRLDEVPQIVNVWKGEMSWIGPRPEAVPLAEWYESQIPFYRYRHIVRPGISGWAQVNQGNVAEIEAATGKLHYDFFYIKYLSFWLDLLVAAKTVRTVLTGFGAR